MPILQPGKVAIVLKGQEWRKRHARLGRKRAEYGISREMIPSIVLRIKSRVRGAVIIFSGSSLATERPGSSTAPISTSRSAVAGHVSVGPRCRTFSPFSFLSRPTSDQIPSGQRPPSPANVHIGRVSRQGTQGGEGSP